MHDDPEREAGDPACWIADVCEKCGQFREDRTVDYCLNCGLVFGTDPPVFRESPERENPRR